eukprot:COSAG06_NODE_22016_length_737_cov_1.109718_1_plen_131_part_01
MYWPRAAGTSVESATPALSLWGDNHTGGAEKLLRWDGENANGSDAYPGKVPRLVLPEDALGILYELCIQKLCEMPPKIRDRPSSEQHASQRSDCFAQPTIFSISRSVFWQLRRSSRSSRHNASVVQLRLRI